MTEAAAAPAEAHAREDGERTGTESERTTEIELKYSVLEAPALAAWLTGGALADAGLALGLDTAVELEDRYVDTVDGRLAAAGFAARLRTQDGRVTISLKGRASEGDTTHGRHQRTEIEAPATDARDPARWPESDARTLVQRLADGQLLQERFRIRQRRREWPVTHPSVSVDDGNGDHSGDGSSHDDLGGDRGRTGRTGTATLSLQQARFYHRRHLLGEQDALEVELVDGDEDVLRRIAAVLEPSGLVEPEETSKEEFAEALVRAFDADGKIAGTGEDDDAQPTSAGVTRDGGTTRHERAASDGKDARPSEPRIVVPKTPGVRVDDSLADAGRKVLAMHLARMLAREAGTRSGDVEELHKMRVATRRMRATWRTFEGAYPPKRAKRYVKELRTVADRLGAVRDLDVQLEVLRAYAEGTAQDEAALKPLAETWQRQRDKARDDLLEMLDSDAYRHFVEDYQAFVAKPGHETEAAPPGMPTRVRDTAGGRVWTSYEHLRAHHELLTWADVPTLHEVRITAKRMRYAMESFREVLGPDADGLILRITALQDQLGELNDADLAAHLVRDYLVREGSRLPAPTVAAVGRYLASRERAVQLRRRGLPAVWRQIVGVSFRRALGRAISSL